MADAGAADVDGAHPRLRAFELRRVRLPLVTPFRTASGISTVRDALLVRVLTTDGEGWGECVAPSEPVYTDEYVDGAHDVMRRHLVPRLFALNHPTAAGVGPALAPVRGHRMAKAALEAAVLDAELRGTGECLAAHLGAVRPIVECGVVIGIPPSIPELLESVVTSVAQGYRRVKLKIEPGWDVEPVRAVREHVGDNVVLGVDANASYRLRDTDQLRRLDPFGLALIEQPLPADHLLAHAELARRISTPVCLDESVTSSATAADAIALGACAIVNVKPGRVGGYLEARRVHDECAARSVPVFCGGMLETGIGRAANLGLAALPNFTLPADLSASDRYYDRDVTPPFTLHHGTLRVPDGPGIGVEVLADVIDELTVSVELLRAAD